MVLKFCGANSVSLATLCVVLQFGYIHKHPPRHRTGNITWVTLKWKPAWILKINKLTWYKMTQLLFIVTLAPCYQALVLKALQMYLAVQMLSSLPKRTSNIKNHWMVWVGRDIKYHPVPIFLPWVGMPPTRPGCSRSHPTWPSTLSGMWHLQPLPGNLFQCLTTLWESTFFLTSNLNLHSLSLKPLSHVVSLHIHIKSPSPSLLDAPFRHWKGL